MKKRVIINALSEYSTPSEDERCGRALHKLIYILKYEGKCSTIKIDVKKITYHKLVVDFFYENAEEYSLLKQEFLYNCSERFSWRESWLVK